MENSTRDRSRVFRVVHPSIHPSIHPSVVAFRRFVRAADRVSSRQSPSLKTRRRPRRENLASSPSSSPPSPSPSPRPERTRSPAAPRRAIRDNRRPSSNASVRNASVRNNHTEKKSTNTTHARRARTHHTARTHRHRALTPERAHDTRAVSESLPPSLGPSLPRSVDGLKKYLHRYTHDCLPRHAFSIRSPAKASTRTEKGQNRGSDRGHVITTYSHHDGRHPIRSEPNRTAFGCFGSTILLLGTELHLYT